MAFTLFKTAFFISNPTLIPRIFFALLQFFPKSNLVLFDMLFNEQSEILSLDTVDISLSYDMRGLANRNPGIKTKELGISFFNMACYCGSQIT